MQGHLSDTGSVPSSSKKRVLPDWMMNLQDAPGIPGESELFANAQAWREISRHMDAGSIQRVSEAFTIDKDSADVRDALAFAREDRIAKARTLLLPFERRLESASSADDPAGFVDAIREFRETVKRADVPSADEICGISLAAAAMEPTRGAWTRDLANAFRLLFPLKSSDHLALTSGEHDPLTQSAYLLIKGDDGYKSLSVVSAGWLFAHAYGVRAGIKFMGSLIMFFRERTRERVYRIVFEMYRRATSGEWPERLAPGRYGLQEAYDRGAAFFLNRRVKNYHRELMKCVLPRGLEVRAFRTSAQDYMCVRTGDLSAFDEWLDNRHHEIERKANAHRVTLARVHAMMNEGSAGKLAYASFKFGRAIANMPARFSIVWRNTSQPFYAR